MSALWRMQSDVQSIINLLTMLYAGAGDVFRESVEIGLHWFPGNWCIVAFSFPGPSSCRSQVVFVVFNLCKAKERELTFIPRLPLSLASNMADQKEMSAGPSRVCDSVSSQVPFHDLCALMEKIHSAKGTDKKKLIVRTFVDSWRETHKKLHGICITVGLLSLWTVWINGLK